MKTFTAGKIMGIDKYKFSDPSIDRAERDVQQVLLHLNNDYDNTHLWLPKRDVIAMAKALKITGEDLIDKLEVKQL